MSELMIVDDERAIRENLKLLFEGEGYSVTTATNGAVAVAKFNERRPDAVLMDIMMPKMTGFAAAKRMHEIDKRVPIVFLTAKDSDADEVHALELGAHDFISKSVECGVLLARVKRALARTSELAGRESGEAGISVIAGVEMNLTTGETTLPCRTVNRLTKTEVDLFQMLNASKGQFLSVDALISGLRGMGFACTDNMIHVHMCNLRKKLGPAGDMIVSERFRGYKLLAE